MSGRSGVTMGELVDYLNERERQGLGSAVEEAHSLRRNGAIRLNDAAFALLLRILEATATAEC